MLKFFLVAALVCFVLGTLLMRVARRQEARHERRPPRLSRPLRSQSALPERRIDLDDLAPRDVVEIEIVSGVRYRFRREQERDAFAVEMFQSGQWQKAFRATVVGSSRRRVLFPRTFALGCSLHTVVQNDEGHAPKRLQMLTSVCHFRERDNPRLN